MYHPPSRTIQRYPQRDRPESSGCNVRSEKCRLQPYPRSRWRSYRDGNVALNEKAKTLPGVAGAPYKAIAEALEVIPRTLVQNCGGNAIRTLTELRVSLGVVYVIE
jgi:hypothetical protein